MKIFAVALSLACVLAVVPPVVAQSQGPMTAFADSDRDGTVDTVDECPNSEPGAPVSMRGCEFDSDGDGIVDHRDRCPHSAPAEPIDSRGCSLGDQIDLPGVVFARASAVLNNRAMAALDDVVETLTRYPNLEIEIAGYTDSRGNEQANLTLSQRRAESVARYIVGNGVRAGRVTARGYGEADPVASNKTAAGREQNRRVVARIIRR